MKNLIIIFLIALAIGCNKNNTNPAPAPVVQNQNQNQNVQSLNAWETPLCYDWKADKHYGYAYANGPLVNTDTYTNTVDCHLLLSSTCNTTVAYPTGKRCENGMYNCNPVVGIWFVKEQDILTLDGQEFRIQVLSTDSLVITMGRAISSYSQKYKFYK